MKQMYKYGKTIFIVKVASLLQLQEIIWKRFRQIYNMKSNLKMMLQFKIALSEYIAGGLLAKNGSIKSVQFCCTWH